MTLLFNSKYGCKMLSSLLTEMTCSVSPSDSQLPGQGLGHLTLLTRLTKLELAGSRDAVLQLANASLVQLQCLHTLRVCRAINVPQGIASMRNLHHLDLQTLQSETCDLGSCFHLTRIKVCWPSSYHLPENVVLPSGPEVQLQSLQFCSNAEGLLLGRWKTCNMLPNLPASDLTAVAFST